MYNYSYNHYHPEYIHRDSMACLYRSIARPYRGHSNINLLLPLLLLAKPFPVVPLVL